MTGRIEKTVFISYRRTNLPWALAIYQELTHHGYDVFFDYLSIPSGDFEKIIVENIRGRAHFVVILTPSALERCNEPGDWLRREIETAMVEKRNIVPLMLESFDFGSPSTANALTGKLEKLQKYNGLRLHSEYFFEGMNRLREQYLSVSLDAVVHPISVGIMPATEEHQAAANEAEPVGKEQLTAQEWFERGYVFAVEARNYDEALRCFSEAIRIEPNSVGAYGNRGNVRTQLGDHDGAIQDYDRVLSIDPEDEVAYYNRGIVYFRKEDSEGAIRDFTAAIRLKPDYVAAYSYRGSARITKNDLQGALADYNKAIHLKPDYYISYHNRAIIWEQKKDYPKAIADYQKYLDLGGGLEGGYKTEVEAIIKKLKSRLKKKIAAKKKAK